MLRALLARRLSTARESTPVESDLAAGNAANRADAAGNAADDADVAGTAGTSRRSLMKQGLWLMAGAVGVGLAGTGVAAGTRSAAAAGVGSVQVAAGGPTRLTLFVRDIRFSAHAARAGAMPDRSSMASPHGQLQDTTGAHIGSLSAGTLPGSDGHIAFHRFHLADGTLIGMGSGRLEDEDYAVVGGTGRYAGAAGSYLTHLRPGEHGMDAEFAISVTGTKG